MNRTPTDIIHHGMSLDLESAIKLQVLGYKRGLNAHQMLGIATQEWIAQDVEMPRKHASSEGKPRIGLDAPLSRADAEAFAKKKGGDRGSSIVLVDIAHDYIERHAHELGDLRIEATTADTTVTGAPDVIRKLDHELSARGVVSYYPGEGQHTVCTSSRTFRETISPNVTHAVDLAW